MLLKHGLAGLAKVPDAGGLTSVVLTRSGRLSNTNSFTVTFSGNSAVAGDRIYYIALKGSGTQAATLTSLTDSVDSTAATFVGSTDTAFQAEVHFLRHTLTSAQITAGSFDITVACGGNVVVQPILVKGTVGTETLSSTPVAGTGSSAGTSPFSINVATVSGGVLLAGVTLEDDVDQDPTETWTGATETAAFTLDAGTGFTYHFATATSLSTETRTVSFAHDEDGTDRAAHSLAIS